MSQEARSEALIAVLSELSASDIEFVLVGGYAVSQYETRFSTDLDLVIAPDDHEGVVAFLEEHDFERVNQFDVPPEETSYGRSVELFERSQELPHPVGVDILVNGLGCRQTKAEWSFDYLLAHSSETSISGGTTSTTALTVDGAVLVAAKLHSARRTDLVDVLAAVPDVEFDEVESHLHRGDEDALRSQLADALAFIEGGGLDHRFKSMFGQSAITVEDKEELINFLRGQLR